MSEILLEASNTRMKHPNPDYSVDAYNWKKPNSKQQSAKICFSFALDTMLCEWYDNMKFENLQLISAE